MTGRMELEIKYNNQIKNIIKNEPIYMKKFDVFMGGDGKTSKTRKNYICNVVRFIHYLKESGRVVDTESDFNGLLASDIKLYIRDDDNRAISKNGNISDSYRYIRHFSLNCFFNFLEDGDYINKNPMDKIKTPKNERMKQKVYLNVDEVKGIEKNVKTGNTNRNNEYVKKWGERDAAIITLGFKNALRVSAIVSINVEDINWENKYLSVIEKGNKPRYVKLSNNTIKVLKSWVDKRNQYVKENNLKTSALFISRKNNRISQQTVGNIVRAYAGDELNDKKRIVPHTMRSSSATNGYLKCKDPRAIQQFLGQKSLAATQKYLDEAINAQSELTNLMEDIYGDDEE